MIVLFLINVIQCRILSLNDGWKFKYQDRWLETDIPSTIHLDLLKYNLIDDPYIDTNLLKLYDLEFEDWEYQKDFSFSEDAQVHQIVFEGLDTHADVYLNDKLIVQANNMHRTWRVTLLDLKEQNNLRVYFHSAAEHDIQKAMNDAPLQLPYNYSYSRKSAYQYGWDWGPRIVTAGIWKDVYIESFDYGRLDAFYVRTLDLNGELEINVDLYLVEADYYNVSVQIDSQYIVESYFNKYQNNYETLQFIIKLDQPRLWWPRGQGEQNLYQVTCQLIYKDQVLQQKQIKTGIRVAKWILQDDQKGQTFKLNLNNRDIYVKGANYIPPDMFMPRALKNPQVYVDVFLNSIAAGYNGLRIWGGGQFEYDIFYELADQYGILLWHDFMFACAMYPGTNDFFENIRTEIKDNVQRLRIHPSIIMWNGNNEVGIGWREWGWASNRTIQQNLTIQFWYDKIFKEVIPKVLDEINPDVFYWETSPSSSFNKFEELSKGDIHFWGVWASQFPIETFSHYIGRFNSEYGMQALIDVNNVKKYLTSSNDINLNSYAFQIHERHIVGIPTIQHYLNEYTMETKDFSRLTYFSQLIQFIALETAIGSLRSQKPYNMGTFYWQINDVWPVVSWATVDFYNCWKGGHYAAKKNHKDPAMFANLTDNSSINVYVVNDREQIYRGNVTVQWITNAGRIKKTWIFRNFEIGNEAKRIIYEKLVDFEPLRNQSYIFMKFDCVYEDCDFYGTYVFTRPKYLKLADPQIRFTRVNNTLTFTSQALAKFVYLSGTTECLNLDNNFFDIVPGHPIQVKLLKKTNFRYMSLYQ